MNMKKLAILLSLVLLVSSMASMGLTASAGTTDGTVVFESDFSTMPEGLTTYSGHYAVEAADGVLKNAITATTSWKKIFSTDTTKIPLVWEAWGNNKYKIEFDWALPEATTATTSELRILIYAGSVRAQDETVVLGVKDANTSGHFEKIVEFNGSASRFDGTLITQNCSAFLDFRGKSMASVTIDNMKITDVSPSEEIEEGTVICNSDFTTMPDVIVPATSGYTVEVAQNALAGSIAVTTSWKNAFTTDADKLPLVWETDGDNKYKIEFDWSVPDATTASNSELRMIIMAGGVRAEDHPVCKGVMAANTTGHFERIIAFNGVPRFNENEFTEEGALSAYLDFKGKSLASFTIDNLKITDLTTPTDAITNKGAQKQQVAEGATTTALRYGFDLACTGVTKAADHSRVIADNATVTLDGKSYKLVDFGALLSTTEEADLSMNSAYNIYGIRAYNLYNVENGVVTYTVGVSNMSLVQPDKMLYARAYVTYELTDGTQMTAYGEKVAYCLNDAN